MEISFKFGDIIGFLCFAGVIYLLIKLNLNTKSRIPIWAKENGFQIINSSYTPWHRHVSWIPGVHPAKFRVEVKDKEGEISEYLIFGGGVYMAGRGLKVEKVK